MTPARPVPRVGCRAALRRAVVDLEARRIGWVVLALAVGVALRLALVLATTTPGEALNRLYPGYTDGSAYLNNARSLVETGVYGYGGRASAFRPPAYPALLAASLAIVGDSLTPVRMLQIALFVLMTAVYAWVAIESFGALAGVLTAWMFAIYPLFVFLTSEIATESLYMILEAFIFCLCVRPTAASWRTGQRAAAALVLGLCCGAGTLTRPNMIFVAIVALALTAWRELQDGRPLRRALLMSILLAAGFAVVVGPWMLRNRARLGAAVLTTNLDYNFFRGTFDLIQGIRGDRVITDVFRDHGVLYEKDIEEPSRSSFPWTEIDNERRARAAAWRIIQEDPRSWVYERWRNTLYLWLNLEWESTIVSGRANVQWSAVGVTIAYYLLLAVVLAGAVLGRRDPREEAEQRLRQAAYLFILAAMPVVATFVGKRYRISMIDPYLLLLAAAALQSWLKGGRMPASRTTLTPSARIS